MSQKRAKKGLLIIDSVEFNQLREKIVIRNNDTSGKVTLPKDWIGKKVYVTLVEDKG